MCSTDFADLNGNKTSSFLWKENFYKDLSAESRANSSNKRNKNLFLYDMELKRKAGSKIIANSRRRLCNKRLAVM